MERIISEIAERFIKKITQIIAAGGTLEQMEAPLLQEAKLLTTQMLRVYAEGIDQTLYEDKSGRLEMGYTVHRKGDERRIQTMVGELIYQRNYYKKVSGGYEYPTDKILGINRHERISSPMGLVLVEAAKDMSYGKASTHITAGEISRQSVMQKVRQSHAIPFEYGEKRKVRALHIDADEDHITLRGGKKSQVPLISVYEGIEKTGKRHACKNVFHISHHGKSPDDLWEEALSEIEERYDLTNTQIYLHGDGANWIQTGLEWLPNAEFVLDKYHKNKAIKTITAGLENPYRKTIEQEMRKALATEDIKCFDELVEFVSLQVPDRIKQTQANARYLRHFVKGISICERDPEANNGGCSEPHVSHILSSRLSSRPMAWSHQTLKQLVPILARRKATLQKPQKAEVLPNPLRRAVTKASKAIRRGGGLPNPEAIGTLPLNGKRTGTQTLLRLIANNNIL